MLKLRRKIKLVNSQMKKPKNEKFGNPEMKTTKMRLKSLFFIVLLELAGPKTLPKKGPKM